MSSNQDKWGLFDAFHAAVIGGASLWTLTKIKYFLFFIALLFFGHLLWQATCEHRVAVELPADGVFYKGIKSKSLAVTPIPDVSDNEEISFQFNGYDLRVRKDVAEWLQAGGLDDPQTELGYLYGKRCKEGLAYSCFAAWMSEH